MGKSEKLLMRTSSLADENYATLSRLFPNAVTETIDEDGVVVRAIDADVLSQEINTHVVSGRQERYQFTWPDKKKSMLLANTPIAAALRPCREESVDFDNTENLYIEGDNLDVLKLLRETYLNRVKMIYIDPPYNTGKDFVYEDKWVIDGEQWLELSGNYDENGHRMVVNLESNGRFHTDWLNMIYTRVRIAKDLLDNDGVIFVSVDDNEVANLKKTCDEIFGERNFIAILNWKGRGGRQDSKHYAVIHEYILCYARDISVFTAGEEIKKGDVYPKFDKFKQRYYKTQLLRKWGSNSRREDRPNLYYPIIAPDRSKVYPMLESAKGDLSIEGCWRWGISTMEKALEDGRVEFIKRKDGNWVPYEKIYKPFEGDEKTKKYTTWIDDVGNGTESLKRLFGEVVFDYTKSPELILRFLKYANTKDDDIVLDFFSGSATTAHAVMQFNAEDGGSRKFIMVQLPEPCEENSEAYKAGYKNICEIGKERIRRAGKKIKEDNKDKEGIEKLDTGFRVLKLDSSNMKDVYYTPKEYAQMQFDIKGFTDNIKPDRSDEDLLFQVMLELDIPLSAKIKQDNGVFYVEGNYLIASFGKVDTKLITEIAKKKPYHAVFRDNSFASDSAMVNFEQIFSTYSPGTSRMVL